MAPTPEEIVRRREALRAALSAAGLVLAPGTLDSAARLAPLSASGSLANRVGELEEIVSDRGINFPVTPKIDLLPALLRDWGGAREVAATARGGALQFRVYRSVAYLTGMIAATLADDNRRMAAWFARAHTYAYYSGDPEPQSWLIARATFPATYAGNTRAIIAFAQKALNTAPVGSVSNALAASQLARASAHAGDREAAYKAIDLAERSTEVGDARVYSAFTFPAYRFHRFASETFTRLGEVTKAIEHQTAALESYPANAVTDRTFIELDAASLVASLGHAREAADHASDVLLSLPAERRLPILINRAEEIRGEIGQADARAASDLGDVLHAIRPGH